VRGCDKVCIISHDFVFGKSRLVRPRGISWKVVTIFSHLVQIFQLELDLAVPLAAAPIESIVASPNL